MLSVQWKQTKVSVLVCIQTNTGVAGLAITNHSVGKDQIAVDIQRICTGYDNGGRDFITKV